MSPDLSFGFCLRRQLCQYGCPPPPAPCRLSWHPELHGAIISSPPRPCATSPSNSPPLRRPPDTTFLSSQPPSAITPSLLRTVKAAFRGTLGGLKPLRSSTRYWAQLYSGQNWSRVFPTSFRPKRHPTDQPLIGRPLYGPRKENASFAYGPLNALALLCLLEGLGVRHE